jgi:Tfp pilus assembly protein PilF
MADAEPLQLVGEIDPPLERGVAAVSAVQSPFYAEAPVRRSRFAFRGLEPGGYTLTVMDPRWGVTRKTVQVTPSFADSEGRVRVEVRLARSDASRSRRVERQGTVSVARLKVTAKARAALRRAHVRLSKGDLEGGVALLRRAVELSPMFTEAWNELGTIAYKARRYVEAEERFREALQHEPLAFAPMVNLGGALLSQGRYEEALSFNLMARSMQPEDALANSQLGMNFFYKQQFQKAREFLLRAKEADPAHFSYPQMFLAEIYAKQGKLGEARAELEEMLRLHPDAGVAALAKDAMRQLEAAAGPG